jgi:hypothetical protein
MTIPLKLVANITGISAVVIASVYIANSFISPDVEALCEARYTGATQLTLRNSEGAIMSPIELQARVGLSEWGMLENAKIVESGDAPSAEILEVSLPKGTGNGFDEAVPRGGIGFLWSPIEMTAATSACLHYDVWLPEDFDFATNGMLPGLFSGSNFDPRTLGEKGSGFGTRLSWGKEGKIQVVMQSPAEGGWQVSPMGKSGNKLKTGRWISVDQEIVLNAPEKSNGVVRMWIDGKLIVETKDKKLRDDDGILVAGVLADVAYGGINISGMAPKDAVVRLSPFSLRWH